MLRPLDSLAKRLDFERRGSQSRGQEVVGGGATWRAKSRSSEEAYFHFLFLVGAAPMVFLLLCHAQACRDGVRVRARTHAHAHPHLGTSEGRTQGWHYRCCVGDCSHTVLIPQRRESRR